MRKNIINITLFASLLTLAGCSNEADIAIPDSAKTPIALSVGVDAPQTRAVITDGAGKTLKAFTSPTDIWMVMQSEYVALSDASLNYKGATDTKYCVTSGTTGAETSVGSKENVVTFTSGNIRYWDDAHARSSRLSVWALAVPNKQSAALGTLAPLWSTSGWGSSAATTKDWTISSIQTSATIANEDLCFSNNISKSGETYDERMKFDNTSNPKAFDTGKLIFYHALTKITIKMVPGDGFKKDGTDFKFDDGSASVAYDAASVPVALNGFNRSGTFNVKQGEFTSTSTANISKVSNKSYANATGYVLEALVMPGTDLNGSLTNAISFSIDGNAFNVSAATLKSKLPGGFEKFEAGNNYIFTFTINKTDIDLTATIAGWDNVEGTNYFPLINIDQSYGNEGSDFGKGFSLYLSQNEGDDASLEDNFAKKTDVDYADGKYTLQTSLYWPDHQKHYLFRGVWPLVTETGTNITPSAKVESKDIIVENSKFAENTYPSYLMIGYPRKENEKCKAHNKDVSTCGICATEGLIRMNFEYVMSQVVVNLSTNTGQPNAVVFDENTTVEIVGGYKEGVILFKDGTADFSGKSTGDYPMHNIGTSHINFHDAIIPQSLGDGETKLKFRIKVTDTDGKQDMYETILGIKDIEVTLADNSKTTIDKWEPGNKYIYNLYITKTGIKVTATIKDWITATGSTNIWM